MKATAYPPTRKELWLVPLEGNPRKLDIDVSSWEERFRLHPDGTQIAFFTGEDSREVWALQDVLPTVTTSTR